MDAYPRMENKNLVAKTYSPENRAPIDKQGAFLLQQLEEVKEFVVCIFRAEGEKIEQIASGFIIVHREKYFVLTAAHVMHYWFSGSFQPRFGIGGKTRGLKIVRRAWTDQDMGSCLRELDIGLWEIDIDGPHGKDIKRFALSSERLRSTGIATAGKHILIPGFPNSMNTEAEWAHHLPEPEVSGYLYGFMYLPNFAFDLRRMQKEQETHVAIDWIDIDENGNKIVFPKGVSGAPAWVFPNDGGINNAKVVGLFIEYEKKYKIGIFTRSEQLVQFIDYVIETSTT